MISSYIKSFDGTKIAYNYFKNGNHGSLIVIVHGFWMSKDADSFFSLSADLFEEYDVVAVDQRGHGSSGGFFTFTANEHEDINCVIEKFRASYKNIILMGFSLGATSSVIEAAKYKNVDRLILVSPPADFDKIENKFYYWAPVREWLFKLGFHLLKFRPGNLFLTKPKPIDYIDKLGQLPVLIIHGGNDAIIFKHHADELFNQAVGDKSLHIIKNGLHAEDLYRMNKSGFLDMVYKWLET